ncbi:MarR family transcriptional regulator [Bacillus mangrovi]|uniref:MarR family transcriptional regulator n=1 Tax=Metabacillus mangrovi TaxID=1491830 RepID=A0A7X2V5Q9_9BACI|nr:MarR family transcriptional regulator [Metabacillus mangrovi]MTH54451.1 MarR family transcriptional regulator [Metabacillus mangrovi]
MDVVLADWRMREKTVLFKRKYSMLVRENLDPVGVTLFQLQMLWFISKQEDMGTTMLADKLSVKPSAVTMGANQLHHSGLLTRVHSKTDRRQIRLRITSEGEALLKEAAGLYNQLASQIFACFSDHEKDMLIQLLDKLEEHTSAI